MSQEDADQAPPAGSPPPSTPATPVPVTPVPVTPVPVTPVPVTPVPVTPVPVTPAPNAPVTPAPNAPVTPAPNAPVTPAPADPDLGTDDPAPNPSTTDPSTTDPSTTDPSTTDPAVAPGTAAMGTAPAGGVGELRVTRWIGRVLAAALARVRVTGSTPEGSALLAVNHTALADGPLLYGLVERPVAFLVKAEVFRGPLGTLLRHTRQIPVRRGTVESAPLTTALDVLRSGGIVGVFPEGTRGDGDVTQVRHGIAYLAVRSGAPVVPVAVHGTRERRGRKILVPRRPPVLVAFGEPLRLPAGPVSRRTVAAAAAEIHRTLAAHVAATRPGSEQP